MNIIRNILLFLVLLLIMLFVTSLFLPKSWKIKKSIDIKSNSNAVFVEIVNLPKKYQINKLGDCERIIKKKALNQAVWFETSYNNHSFTANESLFIKPIKGGSITLTWINEGNFNGNPINRYFISIIDNIISMDLQKNLNNVKIAIEAH